MFVWSKFVLYYPVALLLSVLVLVLLWHNNCMLLLILRAHLVPAPSFFEPRLGQRQRQRRRQSSANNNSRPYGFVFRVYVCVFVMRVRLLPA